jgi:formylmethanofuran dehydrogenase subunit B
MATTRKRTSSPSAKKHRVRIEIPPKADQAVVKALRAVAKGFAGVEIEEQADAPPNSYSLTVHVLEGAQS